MHILVIYRQCGFWIIPINTGNNNVWIFTPIALRWGSSKFIFRVNDLLKSYHIYIIEKSTNHPHTNIYTQIRIKFVDKNFAHFYSLPWGEFLIKNKDTGLTITWSSVEKSDIAFCTLSSFLIFLMRKQQCVD